MKETALCIIVILGLVFGVFALDVYERESKRALIYYMVSQQEPCEFITEFIKENL